MERMCALLLFLVTVAFAAAPLITPPFTGYDPAVFPVRIERPAIQPAGYAFSIWLVIYLWLIVHAAFGLWRRTQNSKWQVVRLPLILSVVIGVVWLAIAGLSPIWGTLTIWVMAAAAISAFLLADASVDRWLLSAPLGMLAGWLSAAAAVSTGVVVAGYGVLTNSQTAVAMLCVVLAVSIAVQRRQPGMPVYGLTVIWALIGVAVANRDTDVIVTTSACVGVGLMVATLLLLRNRPRPRA